jgi:ComF family protein
VNKGLGFWFKRMGWQLFPPSCVLCQAAGQPGLDLCQLCEADLPLNRSCCTRCARPLPMAGLCGTCLSRPPAFDSCYAPLLYEAGASTLVRGLKFHQQLANARLLAGFMLPGLEALADRPQLILPVPLHSGRLRERGFNQSLELARYLGQALAIPVDSNSCQRIKATQPQSSLGKKARKANVRGAFALRQPMALEHLALVDDVITSGNTLNELARLFKKAGVLRVSAWCATRA